MKPTCTALLFVLASSAVLAQNGAPAPNGGFATPGSETTQPVPPSPPSANVPAQKANQYLAIGPFTDNHLSGQGFVDANGRPTYLKFFRVQFRVVDRSVASLEQANIYLFDDSKQLVGTMTSQNIGAGITTVGANASHNVINYPNMIQSLNGLQPNKAYNLIYLYEREKVKWRYAIAVIGGPNRYVMATMPSSLDVAGFPLKEKDQILR